MRKTRFERSDRRTRTIGWLTACVLLYGGASALAQAPAPSDGRPVPTFAKDVAPILQASCQSCHRPGQMAPMSLLTYQEARPYARSIRNKVITRSMPPWHLDKTVGYQKFMNDVSLSDAQIDTIVRWVDGGAPQGDPKDSPPAKQWPTEEGWRMAAMHGRPPDLIVKAPEWTQPATGQDQWWKKSISTGLTEDRWIKAIELRPSKNGRRIVHHFILSGMAEYAVGKLGELYPDGAALKLKAGQDIEFDGHYHSVGEELTDQVEAGFWFYPKDYVPKYEVKLNSIGVPQAMESFDLPPGKISVHHSYTALTENTRLLSFQPHMHIRGKAMLLEAIYPDGKVEVINSCDRFDFNWHINYVYAPEAAPILPKGTILHVVAWHDNTAANKANPDPTQWVAWGQRSFDDMYHAHLRLINLSDEEYKAAVAERRKTGINANGVSVPVPVRVD